MGFYSGDMSSAIWFHWRGWIPTGSLISLTEITGNSEVCVHRVSVNGFNRETATIFFFFLPQFSNYPQYLSFPCDSKHNAFESAIEAHRRKEIFKEIFMLLDYLPNTNDIKMKNQCEIAMRYYLHICSCSISPKVMTLVNISVLHFNEILEEAVQSFNDHLCMTATSKG